MRAHRSWLSGVAALSGLVVGWVLALSPAAAQPTGVDLASVPAETLKGTAVIGTAPAWPRMAPVRGIAVRATRCDPQIIAQPLAIGTKEGFTAAGLLKGFGNSMLSGGLSLLTGGMVSVEGRGRRKSEPELHRDAVKRRDKSKIPHPEGHTKMRVGAKVDEEALTVSVYLDKAKGKGTVHAVYLETPDCRRFWPEAYLAYSLWGEWNLSVSWTQTSETYQDGQLVDRSAASGGWSTGWQRLPGGISEVAHLSDPAAMAALSEYQIGLLEELGAPAWRRMGFSAPTSGPRSTGAVFPANAELLEALGTGQLRAVVHVTREVDEVFQTVAMPLQMQTGEKTVEFALLEGAFPTAP